MRQQHLGQPDHDPLDGLAIFKPHHPPYHRHEWDHADHERGRGPDGDGSRRLGGKLDGRRFDAAADLGPGDRRCLLVELLVQLVELKLKPFILELVFVEFFQQFVKLELIQLEPFVELVVIQQLVVVVFELVEPFVFLLLVELELLQLQLKLFIVVLEQLVLEQQLKFVVLEPFVIELVQFVQFELVKLFVIFELRKLRRLARAP